MYTDKKTIALLEPGPSPEAEREFHEFAQGRVSVLTTRIPFHRMTNTGLSEMIDCLPLAVQSIVGSRPALIVINSFTGSCLKGNEMINMVQQIAGTPAIVPAFEMARALDCLGAKRIALASAFGTEFNMLERLYFSSQGIDIAKIVPIRLGSDRLHAEDPYLISRIPSYLVVEQVRAADLSGIDALVLDSPTFALGDALEEFQGFLSIPVLSNNQVLLHSAFRQIGVPTDHLLVSRYLDRPHGKQPHRGVRIQPDEHPPR